MPRQRLTDTPEEAVDRYFMYQPIDTAMAKLTGVARTMKIRADEEGWTPDTTAEPPAAGMAAAPARRRGKDKQPRQRPVGKPPDDDGGQPPREVPPAPPVEPPVQADGDPVASTSPPGAPLAMPGLGPVETAPVPPVSGGRAQTS